MMSVATAARGRPKNVSVSCTQSKQQRVFALRCTQVYFLHNFKGSTPADVLQHACRGPSSCCSTPWSAHSHVRWPGKVANGPGVKVLSGAGMPSLLRAAPPISSASCLVDARAPAPA